MDIKEEIEMENDPLDFKEEDMKNDQTFEQISGLDDENQKTKFILGLDIKDEIEMKDEPFDLNEEEMENDEVFQILGIEENEILISDADHGEEGLEVKVESSLRSGPQTSKLLNESDIRKDIKELKCLNCNLSLIDQSEFKNYLMSQSKLKFKCAHCQFEFNYKNSLKRHVLNHTNKKLFQCFVCDFRCKQKISLEGHILTHFNFKINKCSEHSYKCNHKSSLKTHILTNIKNIKLFFDAIQYYRDKDGRQLSELFLRLPSKLQDPDYYEIIKQPIDLERIHQQWKQGFYSSLGDVVNELRVMFQNTCRYNEPNSQIYRDALTLQRLAIQKRLELSSKDDCIPDVLDLVQELIMSLFITVFNRKTWNGEFAVEPFFVLPEYEEKVDGCKTKALNFDIMKQRLDKGLYTRLDQFQNDLFSIFDRARKISKENSLIFANSIILQKEFIKVRDKLCGSGSILNSRALEFNEKQLNVTLINQAKVIEREAEDEELTEDTIDGIIEIENLNTSMKLQTGNIGNSNCFSHNQIQYFVGDFVYVNLLGKKYDYPILHIQRLWKNDVGQQMLYGCQYYRPAETIHLPDRKFYDQEVFKTEKHRTLPLSVVVSKCIVLSVDVYPKIRVNNFNEKDVYVCEFLYILRNMFFKKIQIWPYSLPEGTLITERSEPFSMRRVESIFKEQVDNHKEELAKTEEETDILHSSLPNVLKFSEPDCKGNLLYQQYNFSSGTLKLGDFVYVRSGGILHVIRIWVTSDNKAFVAGTMYVRAQDVAIITDRKPYKKEVYLKFKLETLSLSEIMGKCCVLHIKEYITQRHTEIPEKDVYLCEKFYDEMNQRLRTLETSIIKFTNFPPEIYPDEIYYFRKPLDPKKIESCLPLAMEKMVEQSTSSEVPEVGKEDSMDHRPFQTRVTSTVSSLSPTFTTPISVSTTQPSKKQFTGYILFSTEKRKSITEQNPNLNFGEISRIVGIEWKKLADAEKKTFDNKAHQMYLQSVKKAQTMFYLPVTQQVKTVDTQKTSSLFPLPNNQNVPEIENEDSIDERPVSEVSADSSLSSTSTTPIPTSTPKPAKKQPSVWGKSFQQKTGKKQVTGYILFSAEIRKSLIKRNPDLNFGEISRLIGIEWKKLTVTERKGFHNKAHQRNLRSIEKAQAMLNSYTTA